MTPDEITQLERETTIRFTPSERRALGVLHEMTDEEIIARWPVQENELEIDWIERLRTGQLIDSTGMDYGFTLSP